MALSAFDDKTKEPQDEELTVVLGPAAGLWPEVISRIAARFGPLARDWGFAGAKWGWSLRLKHKRRAVLYLTPAEGFFFAGLALGQKAVDAAHESALPKEILEAIDGSRKYAEGRGVRLEIRCEKDVESVVLLADIKMAN